MQILTWTDVSISVMQEGEKWRSALRNLPSIYGTMCTVVSQAIYGVAGSSIHFIKAIQDGSLAGQLSVRLIFLPLRLHNPADFLVAKTHVHLSIIFKVANVKQR